MNKNNFETHNPSFLKGREQLDSGEFRSAYETLYNAAKASPLNEEIFYEMGKALFFLNRYSEALLAYKKALKLNPSYPMPLLGIGTLYMRQKKMAESEKHLNLFLNTEAPDDQKAEALWNLGRFYRLYSDKDETLKLQSILKSLSGYEKILFSNPRIAIEKAKIARVTGDIEAAEGTLKSLLNNPEIQKDRFLHNYILNELEITLKKVYLESKPRSMVAMILDHCNLKCLMCNIWESRWQATDRTLGEIADWFPYLEDISWEGGEVFLMKGFDELLYEGGKFENLSQIIFTNGLMLNEKRLKNIAEAGADIILSIDGTKKVSYEKIRAGGSFRKITDILSLLKEFTQTPGNEIKVQINPVIMRSNYRELRGFIEMAARYGIYAVTFSPIRGIFGNENIFDSKDPEAYQFIRDTIPEVEKLARDLGVRLNNWLPVYEDSSSDCGSGEPESYDSSNEKLFCHAPWQRLTIDNMGSVRPHIFCLNKDIGNVDNMSLKEIWNSPEMTTYRKRIISGEYSGFCQPECISGQVAENTRDIE